MTITGDLKTGDSISFKGTVYRVKLNGTAVLLQGTSPVGGKHRTQMTARKTTVMEKGERAADDKEPAKGRETEKTGRVPSTFFYVVGDLDAGPTGRRLKMGVSGNVPSTLRTYRRRNPGDQVIFTVDCDTEGCARRLEEVCKGDFAEFRVDKSEVYTVRAHEVIRMLRREGYKEAANGIFYRGDARGSVAGVCDKCGQKMERKLHALGKV